MQTLDNWRQLMGGQIEADHPVDPGRKIVTTQVMSLRGTLVETRSGSLYSLGRPQEGQRVSDLKLAWDVRHR